MPGATVTRYPTPSTSCTVSPSPSVWPTRPTMSPSGSPSFSSTYTSREPPAGMTTSSRTAIGGRFSVGRPDLDPDLGDVGLLTVGGRVVEHERSGRVGVEEQLAIGCQRQVQAVDGAVGRADQRRQLGDEQRVVVRVRVVGEDVQANRLADHGDAGVVAGIGFVVGVLQADGDDDGAFVGGAEVVAHRVGQLDPFRSPCSGQGCRPPGPTGRGRARRSRRSPRPA